MTPLVALLLAAAPVPVTFQLNDSYVKDKVLPGVGVAVAGAPGAPPVVSGTTDAQGRFAASLPPGRYVVTYRAPGYVSIEDSPVDVAAAGQTVTTTMTVLLEDDGQAPRGTPRIQLVLNWGSERGQVRDADAHLLCACGAEDGHVYFGRREHDGQGHSARLDVDDMDGGGPETITLENAPAGSYRYWAYSFSGESDPGLGGSEVVVRVVVGNAVMGEYRVPPGLRQRQWRPFKEMAVDAEGRVRIAPFSAQELARGDDGAPSELWEGTSGQTWSVVGGFFAVVAGVIAGVIALVRRARARRPGRVSTGSA